MRDLLDPDHPVLFSLPYEITAQEQQSIIDYAYQSVDHWSGQVQVWAQGDDSYDPTDCFGRIQITRLTEASRQRAFQDPNISSDWLNWACRLDPDLEWEWVDTPITPVIKNIVGRISHLYERFNRALILVQKPGSAIAMHTDKVMRNSYQGEMFDPGPTTQLFTHDNDLHWAKNRYLTLKFPLTEKPGDNGAPLIEIDHQVYRYDVGRSLFAINEVDAKHGAAAVGHRRGVLFLDGILDMSRLSQDRWQQISLHEYGYIS